VGPHARPARRVSFLTPAIPLSPFGLHALIIPGSLDFRIRAESYRVREQGLFHRDFHRWRELPEMALQ
jgi:hypothetical protein